MRLSEERRKRVTEKRLATLARNTAARWAAMREEERLEETARKWARRSETSRKVWAARRAAGWHGYGEKRQRRITEKRLETTRKNRLARMGAMSPEARREEVARRSARRSAASRAGWVTRRRRMGLPPGPLEPGGSVRLFLRDVEVLRRLHPVPARALRLLLTAFRGLWDVASVAFGPEDGDGGSGALDMNRLDAGDGGP